MEAEHHLQESGIEFPIFLKKMHRTVITEFIGKLESQPFEINLDQYLLFLLYV